MEKILIFFAKNFFSKLFIRKISSTHIYTLLIFAHISLIWIFPYFPTQDGPSHIYNLHILHDLIHGGQQWGDYFTFNLEPTPNLGFILFTYPLLSLVEVLTAEKIFITFYTILLGISVPIFISTFSKPSYFSKTIKFCTIPIFFNFTLMMGFYSYAIAVPFFFLAISLAWNFRNRKEKFKFVVYNVSGMLLFFLHVIPFMYYLISLLVFAVADNKDLRKVYIPIGRLLILIQPLIIMIIFYISRGIVSSGQVDFSYLLSIDRAYSLIASLVTFSSLSFSPMQILPISCLWFAILLMLKDGLKHFLTIKKRPELKAILFLMSIFSTIYLLAPSSFGGGGFFNSRIPWVIFLLILPIFADLRVDAIKVVNLAIMVAAIFSLFTNVAILNYENKRLSIFLSGLNFGCSTGDSIILYKPKPDSWPIIDTLLHAPSYYGIFNGCVNLGNYEARTPLFPIKFKNNMTSFSLLSRIENKPESVDFSEHAEIVEVIGWDISEEMKKKLQYFYAMSFLNDKLTLWRRL